MSLTIQVDYGTEAITRMDSNDLVERARQGDHEAYRLIFELEHRFVLRFLYAMVGDRTVAEELTQETFVRAYRNLSTIRKEAKVSTWLCGIAKNVALNHLRSQRKESRHQVEDSEVEDQPGKETSQPDRQVLNSELRQVIHRALAGLDDNKRLVFTLKVMQQLSYEEIAAATGYSIAKLKTDLHRAKAEMRRVIGPYLEEQ